MCESAQDAPAVLLRSLSSFCLPASLIIVDNSMYLRKTHLHWAIIASPFRPSAPCFISFFFFPPAPPYRAHQILFAVGISQSRTNCSRPFSNHWGQTRTSRSCLTSDLYLRLGKICIAEKHLVHCLRTYLVSQVKSTHSILSIRDLR